MSQISSGDKFEFDYPFYNQFMDEWQGKKNYWTVPGCHKFEEREDVYYNVSYTANYLGKIVFEVLSIAKMPGKYMDRVVVKRYYLLPNGEKFSKGEIKMLTTGKFKSYIDTKSHNCANDLFHFVLPYLLNFSSTSA